MSNIYCLYKQRDKKYESILVINTFTDWIDMLYFYHFEFGGIDLTDIYYNIILKTAQFLCIASDLFTTSTPDW